VGLIKRYIKAYSQKVKNNTNLFKEISQLHKQLQKTIHRAEGGIERRPLKRIRKKKKFIIQFTQQNSDGFQIYFVS
jgi:uncharacterized protein YdcH (DUF465 family)